MLQAHSPLWYYLWVAPNFLLLILAALIWTRKVYKQFPVFLVFAVGIAIEQLTLCVADVVPWVNPITWWYMFWAGLLLEALLKFRLIGGIFSAVFGRYTSLAKLGKLLISGVGVVLVLLATLAAAHTPKDNIYWIVSGAHILQQTIYIIQCGLLLFLFLFAAYFRLHWSRCSFGIALGLALSACVHLATWALMANGNFSPRYRVSLDFLNMATDHVCVLIWFYYLLYTPKSGSKPRSSPPPLPEHHLEVWNKELERLLHQ
jgi:hypothetical protein